MIEHCISAFSKESARQNFEIYVTDCLKQIMENTAKSSNGGAYFKQRYADFLPQNKPKKPEKTGDEIALDVIRRAGLKVEGRC